EARVDVRDGWRARVEATRVARGRVVGDVHAEDVLVGEPAGLAREQVLMELAADVEETEPRRAEQVLDRAAGDEVDAERAGVEVDGPDRLVRVGEAVRSGLVREPGDPGDVVTVAGAVGDGGAADERGPFVDRLGESLGCDRAV